MQGVHGGRYMVGVGRQFCAPALAPSRGGMFYQRSNDDKEIAAGEWGLIKDPQRDNPLVSRCRTRRVKNNPIPTYTWTKKDKYCPQM